MALSIHLPKWQQNLAHNSCRLFILLNNTCTLFRGLFHHGEAEGLSWGISQVPAEQLLYGRVLHWGTFFHIDLILLHSGHFLSLPTKSIKSPESSFQGSLAMRGFLHLWYIRWDSCPMLFLRGKNIWYHFVPVDGTVVVNE